jgi:hypothetical protein
VHANPGEISIVAVGPLTNVATVLKSDPTIAPLIKSIVIMGGSLSGGNITPAAEFNFYVDPEAARIVFDSGVSLTMVGLDVTNKVIIPARAGPRPRPRKNPFVSQAGKILRANFDRLSKTGHASGLPCTIRSLSRSSLSHPWLPSKIILWKLKPPANSLQDNRLATLTALFAAHRRLKPACLPPIRLSPNSNPTPKSPSKLTLTNSSACCLRALPPQHRKVAGMIRYIASGSLFLIVILGGCPPPRSRQPTHGDLRPNPMRSSGMPRCARKFSAR